MENSNNTSNKKNIYIPSTSKPTSGKNILFFCLRIVIGVAIITWMVWGNYTKLVKSLESFNYIWLLPAIILYAIHILAGAWRWLLLLEVQDIKNQEPCHTQRGMNQKQIIATQCKHRKITPTSGIKYFEALSLTMQGFFFSLVLPGGSLGGDVVKAAFLAKRTPKGNKLTGTFTILIDRIIGMISLFLLAGIAGLLSYKFLKDVTGFMELIVYALLAGCIVGILSTLVLFFHKQLQKIPGVLSIINFSDKITKGTVSNLINAMDSFRASWKVLLKSVIISIVLIQLMLSAVLFCIASGLEISHKPPLETYVLSSTLANAAGSIPATPAGVGTRDVVMKKIFTASGITSGESVAITLIFTSLILIFNLSGGLFFLLQRKNAYKHNN